MTTGKFDYFVVLAGMRTGSNLLEEQLSAMPGVVSFGEVFNPHFFGKPDKDSLWGLSMAARDKDPVRVIGAMCSSLINLDVPLERLVGWGKMILHQVVAHVDQFSKNIIVGAVERFADTPFHVATLDRILQPNLCFGFIEFVAGNLWSQPLARDIKIAVRLR